MNALRITWKSLNNRRLCFSLNLISIGVSLALLLGIEYIRHEARKNFTGALSGTDLIVGGKSGEIALMLHTVFRIGEPTDPISWQTYQEIRQDPRIRWTIPVSLGDSHRGYRVLGTNTDYFKYYRYGDRQNLTFRSGAPFSEVFDAVIGYEVSKTLKYSLGSEIIVSHGTFADSQSDHSNKPFRVVGILEPTGTPVDRTVHVSLQGIEAIHVDWVGGSRPAPGTELSPEQVLRLRLEPKIITSFLVGLNNRATVFRLRQEFNDYTKEPLQALIPGITLARLWKTLGGFESILRVIAVFVIITGIVGMLATILSGLAERRREMAILRSIGASTNFIFALLLTEALTVTALGCLAGMAFLSALIPAAQNLAIEEYGLRLGYWIPQTHDFIITAAVMALAIPAGLIPGFLAYKQSLRDGLTIKQ